MLDYRIHTFMTLCSQMNYRKTAELLNMTQPGVTQHIHYLQEYYGVKLFSYDGRQLALTPQGQALKQHVSSVLAKERTLRQTLAQKQGIHLAVGATKTIGEFVLTDTLERYLDDPCHTVRFVIDNTERLLGMLEASQLDFAVIEGVFDKSRFGYHLFKKEQYVGICAKDHHFAGKSVSLNHILGQTLVIREQGSGTRKLLEQAICDRGYRLDSFQRCVSVSNFSVILGLAARGDAITFGYAPIAQGREDLATFTVEDMHITGEFNFVYCDRDAAMPKIGQFFRTL